MKVSSPRLKTIVFFLSLVFAFSFAIEGFHHHEDATPHSDCPICAAAASFACDGPQSSPLIAFHLNVSYLRFCEQAVNPVHSLNHAIADRAPPAASLA